MHLISPFHITLCADTLFSPGYEHSKDKSTFLGYQKIIWIYFWTINILSFFNRVSIFYYFGSKSFLPGNIPGYYIPLKVPSLEIDSGLSGAEESKDKNSLTLVPLKTAYPEARWKIDIESPTF